MARMILLVAATAAAALVGALALALPGHAATPRLVATVGPDDTISLRTAGGARIRALRAGVYAITVRDRSSEHNFRISGPGVRKATGVGSTGTMTWKVRLARGKVYRFVCDPHSDEMRGSFRVR
jgi:hypothetical protein